MTSIPAAGDARPERRVRVPALLQLERSECAAACLAMVLAHFGRHVPLGVLRQSCGSGRDGASLANIIEAARAEGLEADAFRREIQDLAALPLPQILFWNFDHFILLEAVTRRGFRVVDPAHGRRVLPLQEFSRGFTGITATFTPARDFKPHPAPPGAVRRFLGLLRGSAGGVATLAITAALLVTIGILVPGFTRLFIDEYLIGGHRNWLVPLLGAMALTGALSAAATALQMRLLLRLNAKVNAMLSVAFVRRLLHLPIDFITRRSAGDVSGRGQHAGQIAGIATGPLAMAGVNLIAVPAYLSALLVMDAPLTGVVVGISALQLLIQRATARAMREGAERQEMAVGQAHAAAIQGVAQLEQYRATGTEDLLFERLLHAQVIALNAEQAAGRVSRLLGILHFISGRMLTIAVLGVGAMQVIHTDMTLGVLAAFTMLAELLGAALSGLAGVGMAMGAASGALMRMDDVLDQRPEPTPLQRPGRLGVLRLSGVVFAYAEDSPLLLDGLELEVAPGGMVGVTGASGAGKTTLGRIAAGLVPPLRGGEVTAGQQPGYVDQTPFLPAGTLRAALTLWRPGLTDDALRRALADAAMLDVVEARPGGLEGHIAEGGADFSGGERQRLALARALTGDPDVLILDDTTGALDEVTEARVLEALRARGVTLLLLTSRPSALARMDRVLVLRGGRLQTAELLETTP